MSNPAVDNDGWSTKKSRQQKRHKVPKQSPTKQNKKSTRNQRRKRNKLSQNQSKNGFKAVDTKPQHIESLINQITACYPRFKSDRNILKTVIKEMSLKSFDPNDHELKANILECIKKKKLQILTENIEDEDETINTIESDHEITVKQRNGHSDITNGHNDDDDEDNDDDDDDDDEDDDEDDEDDDDDDIDEDDEESLEHKESSESRHKSVSIDYDKESKSSHREEPQRKRKRKRARRRRKKEEDHDHDQEETISIIDDSKLSFNLDLLDVVTSSSQLSEWIKLLENNDFYSQFIDRNGLEIIVEKLVLNCSHNGRQNEYNDLICRLFDKLLCGTREYHQWLFSKLVVLGGKLADLNVDSHNTSSLVSIISLQCRNLMSAQTKRSFSDADSSSQYCFSSSFGRPSDLLHGGHQEKDPIVPVLSSLDDCVNTLTDLYNALLLHDSTFSRKVNYDLSGYASIESVLRENISIIAHKSTSLEQELFAMKNEQNELNKHKEMELMDIRQRLENRKEEKYRLLQEKKRIEAELSSINESLSKNDMLMEETNAKRIEITKSFEPKMERLYDSMHDHQFEIAGYAQESSCFSSLLKITSESYNLLDSFRDNLDVENNEKRNELENNYINHLVRYLDKLCDAKMMVINRQNELKQHIESFKKTNETTNKYYALSLNINQQLAQYKNMLNVDENTNINISANIYRNIDCAQKIISNNLFKKFINHLKQNQQIANIIDLTKYTKKPQTKVNDEIIKDESPSINARSKPPFIKNKKININNIHSQSNRRPPRPHYQHSPPSLTQSKRRPPKRSNIINNKLYY